MSTAALVESTAAPVFRSETGGDETGGVTVGGADLLAEVSGRATNGVLFAAGGVGGALPVPDGELVSGASPLPRAESAPGVPVFVGSFIVCELTSVPDVGAAVRSFAPGEFAAGVGVAPPGVGEVAVSGAAGGVLGWTTGRFGGLVGVGPAAGGDVAGWPFGPSATVDRG